MSIMFKNEDRQALLKELLAVCDCMVEEGLVRDTQGSAIGTSSIYLTYNADQVNNRLDMDLVKSNREPLQPFSIQAFERDGVPFIHLYYVDSKGKTIKEDFPLSRVTSGLYDLVSGIKTSTRVSALLHALRGNLRGLIYIYVG